MITYTAKDILTPACFIDIKDVYEVIKTADPDELLRVGSKLTHQDYVRTPYFHACLAMIRTHNGNRCQTCGQPIRGLGRVNHEEFPKGALHTYKTIVKFNHMNNFACKPAVQQAHERQRARRSSLRLCPVAP